MSDPSTEQEAMPEWIFAFQTPNDRVKFVTSEIETPQSMKYHDFMRYVQGSFRVHDYFGFRKAIDSFKDVVIWCHKHEWEEFKEPPVEFTRKQLFEHQRKAQKRAEEKTRQENTLDMARKRIEDIETHHREKTIEETTYINDPRSGTK